jgi:uncharacterized protein
MPALLRLIRTGLLLLLFAGVVTSTGAAPAQTDGFQPVPPYAARVTDQAGMLTADQRARLEAVLADHERQTGSQIAVLLVASTAPEAIEQYGIRVTDAWKLGRKGVDDGVLLLVARDNPSALRRLRIEAGRGVQGVLTDAQSSRILRDTIAPHFRQNDWYGGLVAGVGAISTLLNQEKLPAPQAPRGAAAQGGDDVGAPGILTSIFFIVIGVMVLRSMFRPRRARLAQPGGGRNSGWSSGATGFILGSLLSNMGFSDGGGFSGGGGGSFDGGGASGDW